MDPDENTFILLPLTNVSPLESVYWMWDGELALITSQEEAYFKLNRPHHLGSDIDLSSRGVIGAPVT